MLKASAPQKRMRRGSWCFDVVLDHRVVDHIGHFGSTNAVGGLTCWKRRGAIWVQVMVDYIGDCGSEVGFGEFWMVIGWARGLDGWFLLFDVHTCLLSISDYMYMYSTFGQLFCFLLKVLYCEDLRNIGWYRGA
jgi:hypothetical protein